MHCHLVCGKQEVLWGREDVIVKLATLYNDNVGRQTKKTLKSWEFIIFMKVGYTYVDLTKASVLASL